MIWVNAVSALADGVLSALYLIRYRDEGRKVDLGLGVTWAVLCLLWLLVLIMRLCSKI